MSTKIGSLSRADITALNILTREHGVFNTKFTAVNNSTTEQSMGVDMASSSYDLLCAVRKAGASGDIAWLSSSSAIKIELSTGTVTGTIAGITVTGAYDLYKYVVSDNGAIRIGLSRSPYHKSVPVNYIHTNSATARTKVGSPETAWDAMWISGSGTINATNSCVCIGNIGRVAFDGTNGRASAVTLATGAVPSWDKEVNINQWSVRFDTIAGYGSTNSYIPHFTNKNTDTSGGDAIVSNSTSLGASVTLLSDGVYACGHAWAPSGGPLVGGLSVDSSQLTTAIDSITPINRLDVSTAPVNNASSTKYSGWFPAGTVLRPHAGSGGGTGSGANNIFYVNRLL